MKNQEEITLLNFLIPIFILIPTVIGIFFKIYSPDQESIVSLKYFILPGIYILIYCLTYWGEIKNKLLKNLFLINALLLGFFLIFMSSLDYISEIPQEIQGILNLISGIILHFTFTIIPSLVFFIVLYLFLNKKQNQRKAR